MRSSPGNGDPPQQSSGLAEWEKTEQTWQNTVLSPNLGLDQGSLPRPLLSPSQDKGLDPSATQRSGGRAGVCHRIQPLTSDSSPGQDILYLPSGKCGEGRFGVALNGTLLRTPVLKFLCPKIPFGNLVRVGKFRTQWKGWGLCTTGEALEGGAVSCTRNPRISALESGIGRSSATQGSISGGQPETNEGGVYTLHPGSLPKKLLIWNS